MSKKTKSVIEEAYLYSKKIDETFKANAKEILSHTMGSEIDSLVAETLKEMDVNEINEDDDLATDLEMGDGEEVIDFDVEVSDNDGNSAEMEIIDLTNSSDSELIKVFKAMDPDSEIEVVQDEDGVSFTDQETGAEYKVEMGLNDTEEMDIEIDDIEIDDIDGDMGIDVIDIDGNSEDGETTYELEIDLDDDELDLEEGSRTYGSGKKVSGRGLPKPRAYKRMSESVRRKKKVSLRENTKLKSEVSKLIKEKEK